MSSQFAVLGSPIAHSLSPALHQAAISRLGIDAEYGKFDVSAEEFDRFLATHYGFEGFSLTMPLKHIARKRVVTECDFSRVSGAINTIVRREDGWHGHNTDVWGAQQAITNEIGRPEETAIILGAGATAQSLLVALSGLGVASVTCLVRDTSRAAELNAVAVRCNVELTVSRLGESVSADIVVNTLPGSVELDPEAVEALDGAALFDVVYDPWPSQLASEWSARGLPVVSGKSMLLWQAVRQARIFYGDDVDEPLPSEQVVVTAMRSAIGL